MCVPKAGDGVMCAFEHFFIHFFVFWLTAGSALVLFLCSLLRGSLLEEFGGHVMLRIKPSFLCAKHTLSLLSTLQSPFIQSCTQQSYGAVSVFSKH